MTLIEHGSLYPKVEVYSIFVGLLKGLEKEQEGEEEERRGRQWRWQHNLTAFKRHSLFLDPEPSSDSSWPVCTWCALYKMLFFLPSPSHIWPLPSVPCRTLGSLHYLSCPLLKEHYNISAFSERNSFLLSPCACLTYPEATVPVY